MELEDTIESMANDDRKERLKDEPENSLGVELATTVSVLRDQLKAMDEEHRDFTKSEKEEISGSIGEEPPVYEYSSIGTELYITSQCIVCGEEIKMVNGCVDYICPDCKKAILWAKKKMKEQDEKEEAK